MSPPTSLTIAHRHPSPHVTLIPHLLSLLPNSLPLLRRIQHLPPSPNACVFATFPPSTPPPPSSASTTLDLRNPPSPAFEFAAAWVDRTRAPETECWIFSTWEIRAEGNYRQFPTEGEGGGGIDYSSRNKKGAGKARLDVLAVLMAIADIQPPPGPPPVQTSNDASSDDDDDGGGRHGREKGNKSNDILVIGSLHDALTPLLTSPPPPTPTDHLEAQKVLSRERTGKDAMDHVGEGLLVGIGEPTHKFLIAPPPPGDISIPQLPYGYRFGVLRKDELALCVSRTKIPRTVETLGSWANVCVRYHDPDGSTLEAKGEEKLVGWAFLSPDGSLSSLHVEAAHRGKGLARAVTRRLMMGLLSSEEERFEGCGKGERGRGWMSSDVYWDNEGGKGVAKGLEGRHGWVCRWVRADLGRGREVWRREVEKLATTK
ncbi:MAG: hypothetical protein Q9166_001694 [cf. Caloplaca sp. 2 TL-2023]